MAVALVAVMAGSRCGGSSVQPTTTDPPRSASGILSGAADIAMCGSAGPGQTAALLDALGGSVFTAGDNAYPQGSARDYENCYNPTWGRHKSRTYPSPGNHEYESAGAAPYFAYFGERAGPYGQGYYTFAVGNWTVVSLNSNTEAVTFPLQAQWLRDTLTELHPRCLAAIWHHPLVSSGPNGPSPRMREIWGILQEFGAEFVVTGHEHIYERFTPINADGVPSAQGIREFVVGTGGAELTGVRRLQPGSEFTYVGFGIVSFRLDSESYSWQFLSAPDGIVRDLGSSVCR